MAAPTQTLKRYSFEITVGLVVLVASYLCLQLDLFEAFYDFSRAHEDWELDEMPIILVNLVVGLSLILLRLSRKLRRARARAEASLRGKAQFLSIVSHELRTPLTSIKGALGLLDKSATPKLSAAEQRLLTLAGTNSDKMLALVNNLLDFQNLEQERIATDAAPVDILALVREVMELHRPSAEEKRIRLHRCSLTAPVFVQGDAKRLQQAIGHLLSNAVKFSPPETEVCLRLAPEGARLRIAVEDQGKGIDKADHAQVLMPFAQVDSSDTRAHGGIGLGLALAKRIAQIHGGNLGFDSTPGKGSVFYITLPLARG